MNHIKPTYKVINVDIKDLVFKFDFHRRNKDNCLVYRFPVYKYNGKILIYGEFNIYDDDANTLHVNAFDINNNTYDYNKTEYGKSKVVEAINKKINEELNKLIKGGVVVKDE